MKATDRADFCSYNHYSDSPQSIGNVCMCVFNCYAISPRVSSDYQCTAHGKHYVVVTV